MDPFVHLHVASGYSLKYGGSSLARLVERAADADMDTLALTDRDGMYGAIRFVKACMASGIRPLLGVDLAIEPAGLVRPPAGSSDTAGFAGSSTADSGGTPAGGAPAPRGTPARGAPTATRCCPG